MNETQGGPPQPVSLPGDDLRITDRDILAQLGAANANLELVNRRNQMLRDEVLKLRDEVLRLRSELEVRESAHAAKSPK